MTGIRPTMGSTYRAARAARNPAAPGPAGRTVRRRVIGSFKSDWVTRAPVRAIRRFTVRPVLPEPLQALGELAGNLRWSWHPETQDLFESVDADGVGARRATTRSGCSAPSRSRRLDELAARRGASCARLDGARADLERVPDRRPLVPAARRRRDSRCPRAIAYFSPEFGITAVLPQYSGGLGILAGDHLKTASDLGVPIIGVGLLYRHGYFRQSLSRDGWQQETYPVLDPDGLPLSLLREADGSVAKIEVGLPGASESLTARIWVAQVGRVPLLLLDSDIEENSEVDPRRSPTGCTAATPSTGCARRCCSASAASARSAPTPGSPAPRRPRCSTPTRATPASSASSGSASSPRTPASTSTRPSRCPARAPSSPPTRRCRPASTGSRATWSSSTSAARTPAAASRSTGSWRSASEDYEGGDPAMFNMAVMGFRLAQRANGVSQLHGVVSRGMFGGLWPGFDADERPDHLDHQRRARARPGWPGRSSTWPAATARGPARTPTPTARDWSSTSSTRSPGKDDLGHQAGAAPAPRRRRPRAAAQVVAAARRRAGRAEVDRLGARPRRAHHRLRPPGARRTSG